MACKNRKEVPATVTENATGVYRASVTHVNDLVHTRLFLEPDLSKKELKGKAHIILQPHFYPTDSLTLNAKYMRIESVSIFPFKDTSSGPVADKIDSYASNTQTAVYTYDSLFLRIKLNKKYARHERYGVIIHYVAQPEKVKSKGSQAISDAKGMYFINADGKIPDKPVQVWTQSETEAASCWFPTIDAPNQKSTEEIKAIVPDSFTTISNGRLVSSEAVSGNKRQDYWRQDLPHSPYLFALVMGKFSEVKDQWRGKAVNYYVEPAYEPYARMVFGNTPKMLEFYSNILQVPYPWDKFHQVVVRDFVSGAMENTGCVVHFDKLQHDSREHLDNTYEDIVAHELFHHWFGDLVTCESWSNLPLNESFATYGEYLWYEHQYGRDEADVKLEEFHSSYYNEAEYKSENLVRYHYEDKEDMFDAHSYQKGGSVLHMLRKYVGDEAFFASLKLYLTRKAYKTAEIHDLRQAFEETTGEDLNWFFNQWFMSKGHAKLKVYHQGYRDGAYHIAVAQKDKTFRLPVDMEFHTETGVEKHRIVLDKDSQVFSIPCKQKPSAVMFDAENQLLANIDETKSIEEWESQLRFAKLSAHKLQALDHLLALQQDNNKKMAYCRGLLDDRFWHTRSSALSRLYYLGLEDSELEPLYENIRKISISDPKAAVRKETVYFFRDKLDKDHLKLMMNDSSYEVLARSLLALASIDKKAAFAYADLHRNEKAGNLQETIFMTIGKTSSKNELDFFLGKVELGNGQTAMSSGYGLAYYIYVNEPEKADEAIKRLEAFANDKTAANASSNAILALNAIRNFYSYQLYLYNLWGQDKKTKKLYKDKQAAAQKIYDRVEAVLDKH
jgi:aminopeptidase N